MHSQEVQQRAFDMVGDFYLDVPFIKWEANALEGCDQVYEGAGETGNGGLATAVWDEGLFQPASCTHPTLHPPHLL